MNRVMVYTTEAAVFLALFALAGFLSAPFRRSLREEHSVTGVVPCLGILVGRVARPLMTLLLTWLFTKAVALCPICTRWVCTPAPHYLAWNLFWASALGLAVIEAIAVILFRLRAKPFPVPDLMRNIIRSVMLFVVFFAVLNGTLGVNVAPLLGASALLTAVIGFALQGVLGNLLAGMSLHVVRSVVPSDWVAIDGIEGEVVETNWRETRLRTVAGHVMIIPNSRVASAVIHNMTQPTPRRRHQIDLRAGYEHPPGVVTQELVEAARSVPGVLEEPPPSAFAVGFRDFGIEYRLRFWSDRYYDRTSLEGDVTGMIWYRFDRRGIQIPFPVSAELLGKTGVGALFHEKPADVPAIAQNLRRSELFSKLLTDEKGQPLLQEREIESVAQAVRKLLYTRGESIFRQGEEGESCYVVLRGRLKGRMEHSDTTHVTEFELGAGALFGEMSLMTGMPRTATISAIEEVEVLEISAEAFRRILSMKADIPEHLAGLVAERSKQNAAALQRLKEIAGTNAGDALRRESILNRFLHLLGRR